MRIEQNALEANKMANDKHTQSKSIANQIHISFNEITMSDSQNHTKFTWSMRSAHCKFNNK